MHPIPADIGNFLHYDPLTGVLTWTAGSRIGKLATYRTSEKGYLRLCFRGVAHRAHRIAWFLATGFEPTFLIDHRDCDRGNNALINLRAATHVQNAANSGRRKASGIKGTTLDRATGRWRAAIKWHGKSIYLGTYDSAEEAGAAYAAKAEELFGDFARAA